MHMDSGVSRSVLNNLSRQDRTMGGLLGRLSTGLRINTASDDAAGSAIASKLQARVRGHEQASRNLADGLSLARTADGALSEIADTLQRLRTLAVQAANASVTDGERQAIDDEAFELRQQIEAISRETTFNELPILRGVLTDLNTYTPKTEHFTRGRSEAISASPQIRSMLASSTTAQQSSENHSRSDTFTSVESFPGWSMDDQRIEFESSRSASRYMVPASGGIASVTSGETFTRHQTRTIGGQTYTLQNHRTLVGGAKIYDGLYVSKNGSIPRNSSEALVTLSPSSSMTMAFSNDGSRIAYTSGSDVHVASFDPAALSLSAPTLLNQDGDLLGIKQTMTLSHVAENYTRASDGERSIKVQKRDVTGALTWVPHDPTHTDGYDLAPDGRSLTLYGSGRVDSNDQLRVYYQSDHVVPTDQDGVVEIKPGRVPEVYGLGTPMSSVAVIVGGVSVPYDPTGTSGFDFDAASGTFRLFGHARPAGDQTVSIGYHTDYAGSSSTSANQDGSVSVTLGPLPETWNLGVAGADQAIRVRVGGVEVPHDPTATNGFTLSGKVVSLHGSARPGVDQSIEVRAWTDGAGVTANQDARLQMTLPGTGSYGTTPGSTGPRAIVVQVAGTNVAPDPVDGYTFDPATSTLTLNGAALPDVSQAVIVRYLVDGTPDTTAHDLTLSQGANIYTGQPTTGSVKVERAGVFLQQDSPDGFTLSSAAPSQVRLVGAARPDAASTTAYVVHYTVPGDLVFALTPDLPPASTSCEGIPDPRGAIIDESSVQVTVNGQPVPADPVDGFSITKSPGPSVRGIQTYQGYQIQLNGASRLSGSGNVVSIGYRYTNLAPSALQIHLQNGASAGDGYQLVIDPVTLETLGLHHLCMDEQDEALAAIARLDEAIARLSDIRSSVGAQMNRISSQLNMATDVAHRAEAARSRIVDLDVGKAVVSTTTTRIIEQASLAVLSQSRGIDARRIRQLLGA